MPEAASLSLAVGDRVVYPNQGVCRVSSVEAKEVAGQTLTFVTMKREEDGAVVMVPQSKVQAIGVRKVASADEVAKVFSFLKSDSDKADLDWKQRARTNVERMSQGGIRGLAEVVKGLQVLSELRPLPTKERELYDTARHLLTTEIAVSLGVPECDAEDAIDLILFPVGRERPKRTVAEFQAAGGDEDADLELGDDLLELDTDLPLADDAQESEPEEPEASEEPEPEAEPKKTKRAAKKARLSDDDVTQTQTSDPAEAPVRPAAPKAGKASKPDPKKRGRPAKAKGSKSEGETSKKRARPAKGASSAGKASGKKAKKK